MIHIKSEAEIEGIYKASRIVAKVLGQLELFVKAGASTGELNALAEKIIADEGAEPAFKGYRGYPASICASVNEGVVHGIPGDRRLKDGDIVGLDVGVKRAGFYGDGAVTVCVGTVKKEVEKLVRVAREALYKAIGQAVSGNRLFDISSAIQVYVEANGFSAVRDFVGHGIGTGLHEEPSIPNFGTAGTGPRIKSGMVFAIESMVNMGAYQIEILSDGWTAVTADRRPSAHFEHTVAVTDAGPRILT